MGLPKRAAPVFCSELSIIYLYSSINAAAMNRGVLILAVIALVFSSCNREDDEFLWEYTGGTGTAFFISTTPDSGFISAGTQAGKPFLMRSNRKGSKLFSYIPESIGSYKSVLYDTAFYIAAGSSDDALFITMLDAAGGMIWEKTIESEITVTEVFLFKGNFDGEIIALCGSGPDDRADALSGLMLVRFDTAGEVSSSTLRTDPDLFRLSGAVSYNDGGFIIAMTRAVGASTPKGVALRINGSLQTIWERELSNNPSYKAASLDICEALPEGYVISGRTELIFDGTLLMNSFISLISPTGTTLWKKYPENSNEGIAVEYGGDGLVSMLNRNCFIVNTLSLIDGSDYHRQRVYNSCDSYNTGAQAEDFITNYAGNLLLAGTRSDKYYLAIKSVLKE
jgi:hypothetical protein